MHSADDHIEAIRSQSELDAVQARIVLEALRDMRLEPFDALAREVGSERLVELASTEHGAAWAAVPSRMLGSDHRLAILYALARLFRFDGDAMHLDGALFAALVDSLQADDDEWAESASRPWRQLVMHAGETESIWPQAASLLERFPDPIHRNPGLLGSLATIASACGKPIARSLWEQVLQHPTLGDDAALRWELELEWARSFLLLDGGEPARAIVVLQRVRKGLGDLPSARMQLRWTDATLELVSALTWTGRPQEALQVVEDSLRRVEPGSELETWIHGIGAYPAAACGDVDMMRSAVGAIERAATDTSSLVIRAVIPARLLIAAREHDLAALAAAIAAARTLEAGRPLDLEARAAWRVHAAECALALDQIEHATLLLDDLRSLLDSAPFTLPIHELRLDRIAATIAGTVVPDDAARAAAVGMRPSQLEHDAPIATSRALLDVQLLGPFAVSVNGAPIDDQLWAGRRQARLLLALLLVNDGRLEIADAADVLWRNVDLHTATSRIGPLCNSIRAVLAAAGPARPARELTLRGGTIALRLNERDRCDLHELRNAVQRVRQEPARARELAMAAASTLELRPLLGLGTGGAASMIRDTIEREVIELIPQLAAAWTGQRAPSTIVDAAYRAFDADPSNSANCARLMRLLADRGEPAAASSVFHRTCAVLRGDVGLKPPADLVRLHASIIADDPGRIGAAPTG